MVMKVIWKDSIFLSSPKSKNRSPNGFCNAVIADGKHFHLIVFRACLNYFKEEK